MSEYTKITYINTMCLSKSVRKTLIASHGFTVLALRFAFSVLVTYGGANWMHGETTRQPLIIAVDYAMNSITHKCFNHSFDDETHKIMSHHRQP